MSKLSLKLPKYNSAVVKLTREVKKGLDSLDPILGQIQSFSVAHGGNIRQVSKPEILDTQMKDYAMDISIKQESLLKTNVEIFRDFLLKLTDTFSSEMKKYLFEVVIETTEVTGQVYNSEGLNIWDATLKMVEGMQMFFDAEGNHNTQLYVNPETYKKLLENPPTPEQKKAMEELIKAKREEYYAQKRIRRLS